jgi:DNA-directed RNA polymerase specialized sigma24 family protein
MDATAASEEDQSTTRLSADEITTAVKRIDSPTKRSAVGGLTEIWEGPGVQPARTAAEAASHVIRTRLMWTSLNDPVRAPGGNGHEGWSLAAPWPFSQAARRCRLAAGCVLVFPPVPRRRGRATLAVTELSDRALQELLADDAERGWRAFIDQYTPTLLGFIRRAGLRERDEALDVYVRVCGHLAENGCQRLKRHDPARGALRSWLAVVVRHAAADWVRSRVGRRRLFAAVKALPALEQEVFQLFYWEGRSPAEMSEVLAGRHRRRVALGEVMDALDRVQSALSQRQRAELLSLTVRAGGLRTWAGDPEGRPPEPPDTRPDPEAALRRREAERVWAEALARLAPEEAAILRLKFVQGLTHAEIARALHLERLSDDRVQGIVARLRAQVAAEGALDRAQPGLAFLEER